MNGALIHSLIQSRKAGVSTLTQLAALFLLAETPLRLNELADLLELHQTALTPIARRLIARGLATKAKRPGQGTYLELTAAGRAILHRHESATRAEKAPASFLLFDLEATIHAARQSLPRPHPTIERKAAKYGIA